ncbi:MAG: glycosyltransferase family 2 protein [Mitsuaria chitosanitabida]|uniref:glycosyltransferase family 2 protein n=1 Tax=Roseateles chitosanitabidus TaxID=65048 RepID=UPI001B15F549|nr:glycosyltransferase family 2 protein [Roseateles chitosanitabidus]MBO9686521.1 glycosyltransferase family 2 protein [Roseateles chitosanitabidus]
MHVSFHPDGEGPTAWAAGSAAPAIDVASPASAVRLDGVHRGAATPTLSCIVPAFNEAANLRELLPRLRATLEACAATGLGGWEILVVDDGSADGTAELLRRWSLEPGVRGIRLSRNFGKEAALSAGLVEARGDLVLMMDADLQHDPALIPAFLQAWRRGADMVYAVREHRADEGALKRWGSRGFYTLLNRGARFQVPADAGDFRLMDRRVVDTLLALPERNRFMKGLYAWVGFNTLALPYTPAARAHGETKFRPVHLARLALDGLTAFTNWPLRAVSACGILLAVPAFLYGAYLTALYLLYGHNVSGWTTIVVGLMLFSGLQLVSLGIVGEYVGRIFEEVKGRPLYVVGERSGRGLPERQA